MMFLTVGREPVVEVNVLEGQQEGLRKPGEAVLGWSRGSAVDHVGVHFNFLVARAAVVRRHRQGGSEAVVYVLHSAAGGLGNRGVAGDEEGGGTARVSLDGVLCHLIHGFLHAQRQRCAFFFAQVFGPRCRLFELPQVVRSASVKFFSLPLHIRQVGARMSFGDIFIIVGKISRRIVWQLIIG